MKIIRYKSCEMFPVFYQNEDGDLKLPQTLSDKYEKAFFRFNKARDEVHEYIKEKLASNKGQ